MIVLKWGRIIPETMKVKCKKCGAKLEINKNDVKVENIVEDVGEESDVEYSYQCPCCKRINTLSKLNENLKFALNIE